MTINSVYPYVEKVEDITVAKVILETLSDPSGYFFGIYSDIQASVENNVKEKKVRKIINKYYDERLIDHYEYQKAISFDNEESMLRRLFGQEIFAETISRINTMEELKRYLEKLKEKKGEERISYNTYVPRYKPKK